ncbi:unnamed protein product [Larinioides sclopetarius]|uniref:Uncharacterized protein n=1 Tax=Larinioides sclopetarius TaxID=280406 RepID=A0AAV1Z6V2_9ARAC
MVHAICCCKALACGQYFNIAYNIIGRLIFNCSKCNGIPGRLRVFKISIG